MSRLEFITVRSGDYNRKFHALAGFGGAHNRVLKPNNAKLLLSKWEKIQGSRVDLLEASGKLYILNGQHRIYAASEFLGGKSTTFKADIITLQDLAERGISLADYVAGANAGTPQTINDLLAMHREASAWPDIFRQHGVEAEPRQLRNGYAYSNIIRATYSRDKAITAGRIVGIDSTARDKILEVWLSYPEAQIAQVADVLRWWQGATKIATQRRVTTLYSGGSLLAALLIYHENAASPVLREAPERLGNWAELPNLGRIAPGDVKTLTSEILFAMNLKRSSYMLTVFGRNGRELR